LGLIKIEFCQEIARHILSMKTSWNISSCCC